ncbi:hypothetical protein PV10_07813 [Exophiala mesophila]|uniref:G-protein coupled receptors family 2 profile 2 domain-containing protein n=1 Tax=Exophiala mesophila TaxID=212818 RepID=A0A0D1XR21_EXOME|nr:uncharacterized protein PV10_07813 [Exophiala mesophila]KIV90516.1 hypothetical protein PV10_07813 [Exophiala mesophila]
MSSPTDTNLRGFCPAPFLQEALFPETGGFLSGRFCMPIAALGNATCCLPCPVTDWTYSQGFEQRTSIANWVNLAAFILSVYLVLSFIVLPVKYTHRHYLSVCATLSVISLELAFIIPLGTKPEQCFNEITPNDMRSNGSCAISGAFLLFGGWAIVIWIFCRALALHLQICWEVVPGDRFFYAALAFGWLVPAAGLTVTLALTGVSYRFGNVCHINHKYALQDFWGPLLAFAALALVLQFITIGYCIQVYIRSLLDDKTTTNTSSQAPTYSGSVRTLSARQAYRRVKRVVQLQWRGATIVLVIIGEVVFFAVVFVSMDNSTQVNPDMLRRAESWLQCLVATQGGRDQCLQYTRDLVESEAVVLAVLIVLGLSGFWCLVFFGRWSMVEGWKDFFRTRFRRKNEFVSADARPLPEDPHRALTSPLARSPYTPEPDMKGDYFGGARTYVNPVSNFSYPQTSAPGRDWDPRSTHAASSEFESKSSHPMAKFS